MGTGREPVALPSELAVVDSHTGGEPTRVVVDGLEPFEGAGLVAREAAMRPQLDGLVGFLCGEPRGHAPVHAVLPQPPSSPDADAALLIISALGSLGMCGHALIGAVTTLVETGMLPDRGPRSRYVIETLAGPIAAEAEVDRGRVRSVTFENAPAWVLARSFPVTVPDLGRVEVDVVYGGLWYAVLAADAVGLTIEPGQVARLVALSHAIRAALNADLGRLPDDPLRPTRIPQLLWTGPGIEEGADGRNLATSSELGYDRSPCGTGSSARMALEHARGRLGIGQPYVHESVIGSRFRGELVREVPRGAGVAVVPRITGSAHLTARSTLLARADDPLAGGFHIPPASD